MKIKSSKIFYNHTYGEILARNCIAANYVRQTPSIKHDRARSKKKKKKKKKKSCLRLRKFSLRLIESREDIRPVPQCTTFLFCSESTSHNTQCLYDYQDQFSQFSPHCLIHVHSSINLKDTVWIAKFSWFPSLFGVFKVIWSLYNMGH